MIRTYKARVNKNNISYLLTGKQGNTMRYNFVNGNVTVNKCPTLTLRNRYAQELLEASDLVKQKIVIVERTVEEYDGELAERKADAAAAQKAKTEPKKEDETDNSAEVKTKAVAEVTSADELLAYVNSTYEKEYKSVSAAVKFATQKNLSFPNLHLDID